MPGRHNRSNVCAALTVVQAIAGNLDRAIGSLASYASLPHRLQVLGTRKGVTWINDSISSTPVARAAALEALAGKPLILLVGGLDRGLDWAPYLPAIRAGLPEAIIGMPNNGPTVLNLLREFGLHCPRGLHEARDLEHAVELCRELMSAGDTVLLSPGAPSFPQFRDFQHRGNEFGRLAGF